jgi:DNA gyrase subunit A
MPSPGSGGNGQVDVFGEGLSGDETVRPIDLAEEARKRYLSYALSVVTSRALPDVRDGLKPVQRRILYAMHRDFHLTPEGRHRKSATVVGRVIGVYHPHGDQAVYEAMVRLAQPFTMRSPLVDGHGNFGSIDGDPAAAYRYTEVKLQKLAMAVLEELGQDTVESRPNFDGSTDEPVVLPAQFPNLLVNGSSGIAVGMATNIPPHNLREVVNACLRLVRSRELSTAQLMTSVKGPDFPVGGEVITERDELVRIYEEGRGSIKVRATYQVEEVKRSASRIVVQTIPYMINKATVVEDLAELIAKRKVPGLADVRDESTEEIRIVLELKAGTDPAVVMAYLFKHTALESNFAVNMMCLVSDHASEVPRPARLSLRQLLLCFLDFRFDVVTRRLTYQLRKLRQRIHILEGFRIVFGDLDEAIAIIRRSDGKADASQRLRARFALDEEQAEAILETKLHKLARLEIRSLLEELEAKQAEAARIEALLSSEDARWDLVAEELKEVSKAYGDARRTVIGGESPELEYDPEAYIESEDTNVVLTRDGWIKRVQALKDPHATRVREGDEVLAVLPGNTREAVALFSNFGLAYVMRISDVPATGGYGDPVQKFFKFSDGERVVAALSLDPRVTPPDWEVAADEIPPPYALTITRSGQVFRFPLAGHRAPSTRTGRRFCRLEGGDEVVDVQLTAGTEVVVLVSRQGKALLFPMDEVAVLSGPGKGVRGMRLRTGDEVLGVRLLSGRPRDVAHVETAAGRVLPVGPAKYRITHRGGTGADVVRRGGLTRVLTLPVEVVELEPGEAEATAEPVALDAVEEVDEVDTVDEVDEVDAADEGSREPGPGRQGELF